MNKLYYLVLTIVGFSTFCIYADNAGTPSGSDDNPFTHPKNPGGRPKAPSREVFVCSVENGMLAINFRKPEGIAEIELLNLSTGFSLSFEFDTAVGFRYVLPTSSAIYEISIRTEKGNTYVFTLEQ